MIVGRRTSAAVATALLCVSSAKTYADEIDWQELATRPSLLDGAGSVKETLRNRGISTDASVTQFYQAFTKGTGPNDGAYGSRADVYVRLDGAKLGLWQGLFVSLHQDWVLGDAIDGQGGTVLPVNTALAFPPRGGHNRDTSLVITQAFNSNVSVSAGKFDMFEQSAKTPIMGGGGLDTFMNLALATPITGITPPYLLGANLTIKTAPATVSFFVYDPRNAQDWNVIQHPFADGTTYLGAVTVPVNFGGLDGFQNFKAAFSTQEGIDFNSIPELALPPEAGGSLQRKDGRWYFAYSFQQYLYQSPANPQQGWGVFGQFGVSDGNPNPLETNSIVGIGGTGTLPSRPIDRWGVAYFRYNASDVLTQNLELFNIHFDHESGVEAFYNLAVTPWFRVTADAQFIHPVNSDKDDAVFLGLRNQIKF